MRTFVDAFAGYDAVVTPVAGRAPGSVRAPARASSRGARATRRLADAVAADVAPQVYELSRVPRRRARRRPTSARTSRTRVTYHPTCHSLRMLRRRRPAAPAAAGGARAAAGRPARRRGVLRLRRHLRGEERRHVGGDGRRQGAPRRATPAPRCWCAGDNSCLMHIGGLLSRQRAGVRVMHLAEILAATEAPTIRERCRRRTDGHPTSAGTAPRSSGMPAFPEAARAALARHPAARTTSRHATAHDPRQAGRGGRRGRRLGGAARWPARRSRTTRCATSTSYLRAARGARDRRAAATVHWARDAAEANAIVADWSRGRTASTRSSRSSRWPPRRSSSTRRWRRQGIAAWETDLAELIVQLGDDLPVAHPGAGDPPQPGRDPRDLPAPRWPAPGRPAPDGPDRRARPSSPRPPGCTCARSSCAPRSRVSGANFAVAETGTLVVVESEGNGRMCLTLPEVLVTVVGIEKVVPTWRGPRGVPAAAAALVDRRADEPLHLDLDRGHPRRRAAGGPRRAARQRPHPRARRRGRPAGAALHPLLGLPQRLPGLRADRRARLRLGLPRPDRRDPHPAAQRASATTRRPTRCPTPPSLCGACFEVCPVRIDIPAVLVAPARQVVDAHRGDACPKPEAVAMKAAGWRARRRAPARAVERRPGSAGRCSAARPYDAARRSPAAGRLPGPGAAWTEARDLPAPPRGVVPRLVAAHRRARRREVDRHDARATRSWPGSAPPWPTSTAPQPSGVPRDYAGCAGAPDDLVDLFAERVADYRAVVERCAADDLAGGGRRGAARRRRHAVAGGRRAGAWTSALDAATVRARDDAPLSARRPRRRRRRRHRRARSASPRPAPSCSTTGPARAAGRSPWCPTCTSASSAPTRSSPTCPTRSALPRPDAAADLDQRPVRDQRHRARPGRGRARPADPARPGRRRLTGGANGPGQESDRRAGTRRRHGPRPLGTRRRRAVRPRRHADLPGHPRRGGLARHRRGDRRDPAAGHPARHSGGAPRRRLEPVRRHGRADRRHRAGADPDERGFSRSAPKSCWPGWSRA